MRKKSPRNFAFIDAQNLTMGILKLGWQLNWKKFAVYMRDKYHAERVFVFIGFIERNTRFYEFLRQCGYILIFKPVVEFEGKIKGNCDADMILYIMSRLQNYDKAIIVTSDGDFYSVVRFLRRIHKLEVVVSSHVNTCSKFLKREAGNLVDYLNHLESKLSRD